MNEKQIEIIETLITCLRNFRPGDDKSFYKERQKVKEKFNVLDAEDFEWFPIEVDFLNILDKIRKI